jgi:hypothetical protein
MIDDVSPDTVLFFIHSKSSHDYETVPILRILETKDLHKLIPAIGCLYVIACSAALLEVFTETFQIIVRFATSEWKILLKQISYESRDSGNPVLAIFVGGSLVAILAFACPMQSMTFIIAGSQLTAGILRAVYFLYAPFRPKSMNPKSKKICFKMFNKLIEILFAFLQKIPLKLTADSIQEIQISRKLRFQNVPACWGSLIKLCHQSALTICQNQFRSSTKTCKKRKWKKNGFCLVNPRRRSIVLINNH